jgi:hypothetical protein
MMPAAKAEEGDQSGGIDKSVLTIAEPRRYRNSEHLRFVATKSCLICGRNLPIPIIYALPSRARSAAR